jgi:hypothetical protein
MTKNTALNSNKLYEAQDDAVGRNSGMFRIFRCKRTGNSMVNGTDVNAPINATKSLKNGTTLATKYDVTARTDVSIHHRRAGENGILVTKRRSKEEQMACELIEYETDTCNHNRTPPIFRLNPDGMASNKKEGGSCCSGTKKKQPHTPFGTVRE